mmetsp:Transcript_33332/g.56927  ORF Transcript_33332/g.56927 Transcript_33332/m.56927 type:complete len:311 (+) Transcript_33332:1413-2345(+)
MLSHDGGVGAALPRRPEGGAEEARGGLHGDRLRAHVLSHGGHGRGLQGSRHAGAARGVPPLVAPLHPPRLGRHAHARRARLLRPPQHGHVPAASEGHHGAEPAVRRSEEPRDDTIGPRARQGRRHVRRGAQPLPRRGARLPVLDQGGGVAGTAARRGHFVEGRRGERDGSVHRAHRRLVRADQGLVDRVELPVGRPGVWRDDGQGSPVHAAGHARRLPRRRSHGQGVRGGVLQGRQQGRDGGAHDVARRGQRARRLCALRRRRLDGRAHVCLAQGQVWQGPRVAVHGHGGAQAVRGEQLRVGPQRGGRDA